MRELISFIFLTLVLAPNITFSSPKIQTTPDPLSIPPSDDEFLYATQKKLGINEIAISSAYLVGPLIENTSSAEAISAFGLRYSRKTSYKNQYDFEINIASNSYYPISYGYRTDCCQNIFPALYYKLGVGSTFRSTDGTANLTEFRRYKIIAAIGNNDILNINRHIQMELGLGLGIVGAHFYLNLAYVFDF